ncbi:MAG: outer membrane protein [Candidatus Paceibacteria bacterium]
MYTLRSLIIFLVMMIPVSVSAQNQPFSGFYAGARAQYTAGDESPNIGLLWRGFSVSRPLSFQGESNGIQIGFWRQLGQSPWRWGVEVNASRRGGVAHSVESMTIAGFPASVGLRTELRTSVALRLQAGYVVGDRTMLYGFASAAGQQVAIQASAAIGPLSYRSEASGWGPYRSVGLGVSHMFGRKTSAFVEVSQGRMAVTSGTTTIGIRRNNVTVGFNRFF